MERLYKVMYRLGVMPWDRPDIPEELARLVGGSAALDPGVAFDIGCGTGLQAAYLADHGWDVTAIDVSATAIDRARRRSDTVHWVAAGLGSAQADRAGAGIESRATLILDVGCLHGLDPAGRSAWAIAVQRVAADGAVLLLRASPSGSGMPIGPKGIAPESVDDLLGSDWVTIERDASGWSSHRRRSAETGRQLS
jgi:SAM-dependent methyltransferase